MGRKKIYKTSTLLSSEQEDIEQEDIEQEDIEQEDIEQEDIEQEDIEEDDIEGDDIEGDDIEGDDIEEDDIEEDDIEEDENDEEENNEEENDEEENDDEENDDDENDDEEYEEDEYEENGSGKVNSFSKNTKKKETIIIVEKEKRKTSKYFTKYEITRIISIRSNQIQEGAPLMIDLEDEIKYDIIEKVILEFVYKKTPLLLRRPIGNNTYEQFEINELDILNMSIFEDLIKNHTSKKS